MKPVILGFDFEDLSSISSSMARFEAFVADQAKVISTPAGSSSSLAGVKISAGSSTAGVKIGAGSSSSSAVVTSEEFPPLSGRSNKANSSGAAAGSTGSSSKEPSGGVSSSNPAESVDPSVRVADSRGKSVDPLARIAESRADPVQPG